MNFFDTGLLPVALDIIYGPLPGGPVGSALLLLLVLLVIFVLLAVYITRRKCQLGRRADQRSVSQVSAMTVCQTSPFPAALDLIADRSAALDGLLWVILLVILAMAFTAFVVSHRK